MIILHASKSMHSYHSPIICAANCCHVPTQLLLCYYFSLGNGLHLPPTHHLKGVTVCYSVSSQVFLQPDACSRIYIKGFFCHQGVCMSLCVLVWIWGGGGGLHPGWVNSYERSSLSQSAGEHHASWFLIGWLSLWAQLIHRASWFYQRMSWGHSGKETGRRSTDTEARFRVCSSQ